MRSSLFEQLRAERYPPPEPQRLSPNAFARLARWAWRSYVLVLFVWALVAVAAGVAVVRYSVAPNAAVLQLPTGSGNADEFALAFPGLEHLQTLTLSNSNLRVLDQQVSDLVSTMRQQREVYDLVFAPGSGDYYASHGLLYHPLAEIKQRVAYALSLKPLFEAIGEAPNANSMATLVNELAASVEQGREPQGLESLLSQSATSVQELMVGVDQPVDWSKVAALESGLSSTTATVLALPKPGQEDMARNVGVRLLNVLNSSSETQTEFQQNDPVTKQAMSSRTDWPHALAASFIGFVFSGLVLALALGRVRLAFAVLLPMALAAAGAAAVIMGLAGPEWINFWCIGAAACLATGQISLGYAAAVIAMGKDMRARETSVMLAAQVQGRNLLFLALLAACIWPMALAMQSRILTLASSGAIVFILISLLCALTLLPAIFRLLPEAARWRAGDWLVPAHQALFESGRWQFLARGLAILALAAGLFLMFRAPAPEASINTEAPVNVFARSKTEAEALIAELKRVPEAGGVRWLGMFLPPESTEKRAVLAELKDRFTRITPVSSQAPDDVRDQIDTLQQSLQRISALPQTRPELRDAADSFRRSLALLGATSGDTQIKAFENRLFGGYNLLADRSEILASLPEPTEQTLPEELRRLFMGSDGSYRLEVTPAPGVLQTTLAFALRDARLPVVHPAVSDRDAWQTRYVRLLWLMGLGLAAAAILLMLLYRGSSELVRSGLSLAAGLLVLLAAGRLWQADWTLPWLTTVLAVFSYLFASVATAARTGTTPAMDMVEIFLWPIIANCIALPFVVMGLSNIAAQLVPLAVGLAISATMVALLHSRAKANA